MASSSPQSTTTVTASSTLKPASRRDAQFNVLVEDREIAEPKARLPRPPQRIYYVRIRATDPDGFVGPFTPPQRFEVINRVIDSTGANLSTSDGQPVRLQ